MSVLDDLEDEFGFGGHYPSALPEHDGEPPLPSEDRCAHGHKGAIVYYGHQRECRKCRSLAAARRYKARRAGARPEAANRPDPLGARQEHEASSPAGDSAPKPTGEP